MTCHACERRAHTVKGQCENKHLCKLCTKCAASKVIMLHGIAIAPCTKRKCEATVRCQVASRKARKKLEERCAAHKALRGNCKGAHQDVQDLVRALERACEALYKVRGIPITRAQFGENGNQTAN